MPKVNFGTKSDEPIDLIESDDLIAVRTRSKKPMLDRGPVARAIEENLVDCGLVLSFPEAGVEIYQMPKGTTRVGRDTRKSALRRDPDVRFAGDVLIDKQSKSPVLYTENFFIKFRDDVDQADCERIIREANLSIKEKLGFATNAYFIQATEGTGQAIFQQAMDLLKMDEVENCHPEIVRPRSRKLFFPNQWHLASTSIKGMLINSHASVDLAHAITQGQGSTIAIIDDGVDLSHPEFARPGKIVAPFEAMSGTNDPSPGEGDHHGTACAGVACAAGVDGAAGVAPAAKLMPVRLAANLGSMAEAKAFEWAANNGADVISCSWGPPDGIWYRPNDPQHNSSWPLPASTRHAIDYAFTKGRQGRGCVVFFAAGNGNESVDLDGYASYQNVIAVAACNDRGTRSVYSDFGKAVSCCFPSSDFELDLHPAPLTTGIWTTDLVGDRGYNEGSLADGDSDGNYTNSFGGTSSASPGAAGVAALVLSMNPDLTAIEVRNILESTADKIDSTNGQYVAGRSKLYGFGRLNALRAVENARPPQTPRLEFTKSPFTPIPDLGIAEVKIDIVENAKINQMEVAVRLTHSFIGDLIVELFSPGAASSIVLHNRTGGAGNSINATYRSSSLAGLGALTGRSTKGTWLLRVQDKEQRDDGTLEFFGLKIDLMSNNVAAPRRLSKQKKKDVGPADTSKQKVASKTKKTPRKKRAKKR